MGPVSSAVGAALASGNGNGNNGKGGRSGADALALRGLFDRRQLTAAGSRKWLLVDERGAAAVVEVGITFLRYPVA